MNREFEQWFKENLGAHSCQFDKDEDGEYEERETICAWYAWQEQQKKMTQAYITLGEALNNTPDNYEDAIREAMDDLK